MQVLRYAAFPDLDDPSGPTSGGNPAGVVLDAHGLTPQDMQRVAGQVGYSETAFLMPTGPASARVRYFAPECEVAFCGHATIATAVALAGIRDIGRLDLATPAGPVLVEVASGSPTMATLVSPPATTRDLPAPTTDALLSALHWSADDLDPDWPTLIGSAGNDHPILVARSRARLSALDYGFGLLPLMRAEGWTTLTLLWSEPGTSTLWARNPFPVGGVTEDPATGAAAAAVGGYLRDTGRARTGDRWVIRQGHDMGRPSRIDLEVGTSRMRVSGTATPIRWP